MWVPTVSKFNYDRGGGYQAVLARRRYPSRRDGAPTAVDRDRGNGRGDAAKMRLRYGHRDGLGGQRCLQKNWKLVSLKWKHSIARSWNRAARPDIKRSLKDTDMIWHAHHITTRSLRNKKKRTFMSRRYEDVAAPNWVSSISLIV